MGVKPLSCRSLLAALACAAPLVLSEPGRAAEFLIQSGIDSAPYSFIPSLVRGNRETNWSFNTSTDGTTHNFVTYVRFDVPGGLVGPGERITRAFAWTYYSFDDTSFGDAPQVTGEMRCHEVLGPWSEGTLTWANRPRFAPPFDVQPDINGFGLIWCDVTELARRWASGGTNHGIVFTNPTERLIGMWSFEDEANDPNFRPSLVIETGPLVTTDSDGDGVPDVDDVCPGVADPGQSDVDTDGFGDACDVCPTVFDPTQDPDRCGFEAADLNGDLAVDEADVTTFEASLGSTSVEPAYRTECDLDGDGRVVSLDQARWTPIHDAHRTDGGGGQACGLLGLEALPVLGLFLLRRRRRRS